MGKVREIMISVSDRVKTFYELKFVMSTGQEVVLGFPSLDTEETAVSYYEFVGSEGAEIVGLYYWEDGGGGLGGFGVV